MKLFLLAVILVPVLAAPARETVCIITKELNYVCGADGKWYGNPSAMRCANVEGAEDPDTTCGPNPGLIEIPRELCIMTLELYYTCGADGTWYDNPSQMRCANVESAEDPDTTCGPNPGLIEIPRERREEPEEENDRETLCIITFELNYVCGADGKWYGNPSKMRCANVEGAEDPDTTCGPNPGLIEIPTELCIMTMELDYTCGADGKWYGNPSAMRCANVEGAEDPDTTCGPNPGLIEITRERREDPEEKTETVCIITKELNYVCGADGKWYGNPSEMRCKNVEGAEDPDTTCGPNPGLIEIPRELCIMTLELRYTCGADGKWYANPSAMRCANVEGAEDPDTTCGPNPGLIVITRERREDPEENTETVCIITMELNYVCGADGKWYGNPSEMRCKNVESAEDPDTTCGPNPGLIEIPRELCIATLELHYTCGADGKWYANPSAMRCANVEGAEDPDTTCGPNPGLIEITRERREDPGEKTETVCIITKELNYVCGADGKWYGNPSEMRCKNVEGAEDPDTTCGPNPGLIEIPRERREDPVERIVCTDEVFYQCGENGVWYRNPCLLRANNMERSDDPDAVCGENPGV